MIGPSTVSGRPCPHLLLPFSCLPAFQPPVSTSHLSKDLWYRRPEVLENSHPLGAALNQ